MQSPKSTTNFLLLAAVTALAITLFTVHAGQQPGSSVSTAQRKSSRIGSEKDEKDKMPLALSSASLPTDPKERAIRLARGRRYDNRDTTPLDDPSADTGGRSVISEWYLYVPALPTAESDAVVLGKVVDAKGYLSNDKTGAYSEFNVSIKEVFKDSRRFPMTGGSVVVEREGANVKLPDGGVIRYQIAYQGMPQPGRSYVLFLKYNEQGDGYQIITGYELHEGRILPLDQADHFAAYKDSDEETFLNAVREAVVRPQQSPRERRRLSQ
jgi:hypothetical protein